MKCPRCKQENIVGSVYCDNCGANLKEAQFSAPVYGSADLLRPTPAAPPAPVFSSAPAPAPVYAPPAPPPAYAPPVPSPAPTYAPPAPPPAPAPAYAPPAPAPAPPADPAKNAFAVFKAERSQDKFYVRAEKTLLGRGPGEPGKGAKVDFGSVPEGGTVSKKHAVLIRDSMGVYIEDVGSGNGTFINEEKIPQGLQRVLHDGDKVRLGGVSFIFSLIQNG
ncbi:FHA domain-containing protein [bacterium]|nr:FHA domain-containing protein [bacterium]